MYGGWAYQPLGDLSKMDVSAASPTWALLSPTGDVPPGRVQPYMARGGNGLVYMMSGYHFGYPGAPAYLAWDVYVLDTKPSRVKWTKIAGWSTSSWANTVEPRHLQVLDNQLYITGLSQCLFSTFRMNISAPTSWTNVTEMITATPCSAEVFSQSGFLMLFFKPEGATTNTHLVFDLKTLGKQVRDDAMQSVQAWCFLVVLLFKLNQPCCCVRSLILVVEKPFALAHTAMLFISMYCVHVCII